MASHAKARRKEQTQGSPSSVIHDFTADNGEQKEQLYCLCRTPYDKKRFMIACDACEEWFHGDCVSLTERESKNIDKYFCFMCKKKDPSLQIVFKKPPVAKKASGGASGKQRRGATSKSSLSDGNYLQEDKEPEEDYSSLPVFLQPDPNKQCFGLDCINPARRNSKFCSTTCGYTFYEKALERHLKPAVEKRIANPELFGMKKTENELEMLRVQRMKSQEEVRKLNLMDSKLELLVVEAKRVAPQERASTPPSSPPPVLDAVLPPKHAKHGLSPKPLGPSGHGKSDTVNNAGFNNKKPGVDAKRGAGGRHASGPSNDTDTSMPNMSRPRSSSPTNSPQQINDPVLSDGTFVCIVCGKPVQKCNGLRHVERCYKRAEKYNNFSSGYRAEGEAVKVFCDHFSKKDGSFCKRLKFICPEHYRDNQASADEVCGFPLNIPTTALVEENFMPSPALPNNYCNDYRRDCAMHYNWENMWRSMIASRKLQTWMKVEENIAREFKLRKQPSMASQPTFDIVTLLGDNLEYSC